MEPLDFGDAYPRPARAEDAGVAFLPRSIDTCSRASQSYRTHLRRPLRQRSDEDVASFVKAHAVRGGANAWNGSVLVRELYDGVRAEAIVAFPRLAEHPETTKSLDFLRYREDNGLDDD